MYNNGAKMAMADFQKYTLKTDIYVRVRLIPNLLKYNILKGWMESSE